MIKKQLPRKTKYVGKKKLYDLGIIIPTYCPFTL